MEMMKKIAIFTPCMLPIPATRGGAVEGLITRIIEENEISKELNIELYTIVDPSAPIVSYIHTRIVDVHQSRIGRIIDRVTDKIYRTIGSNVSVRRCLDKDIRATVDTLDYDAVIVENVMSTALEVLKLRKQGLKCPIYFHIHNEIDIYRSPEDTRRLVAAGVQFIAVSDFIKKEILAVAPRAVVYTLINGIDLKKFAPLEPAKDLNYIYSGRIIRDKGLLELIEAYNNYKGQAKLTIIGFSERPTLYEKKVLDAVRKSDKEITCVNRQPSEKMPEFYAKASAVFMPTLNEEPFGLVALETMAMGVPIVITDSGALPFVVGNEAGIIVRRGDTLVKELTEAMYTLEDKESRNKMGKSGIARVFAEKDFNIDSYYERFKEIIEPKLSNGKISVVIPVYNVENRLPTCVDSVLAQSYSNLEIILIDDGSKDKCGDICDDYALRDNRIKVIHQSNRGLSGARNAGLDAATGDYIFFLDSDDTIYPDTLTILINTLETSHSDVVCCGVEKTGEEFSSTIPAMFDGHQAVIDMMRTNNICTVAWNKLCKAKLWKETRFPEGRLHEDEATIYKPLYESNIVTYIQDRLYQYYVNENGIMSGNFEKRNDDFLWQIKQREKFFMDKEESELAEHSVITELDHIKYIYRNTQDDRLKRKLIEEYKNTIKLFGIPKCMGKKKQLGFIIWNYLHF